MAANQRLSSVLAHLNPLSSEAGGRAKLLQKNPDDIVLPFLFFISLFCRKLTATRLSPTQHELPLRKPKKEHSKTHLSTTCSLPS